MIQCCIRLSWIASLCHLWLCGSFAFAQSVVDPNLRVARYVGGFDQPTGVAFLDANGTALVAEKATGQVKLVQNRKVTAAVLDLPVANDSERGLLSIALSPHFAMDHFVYLYHTASDRDGGQPIANRISRYLWNASANTLTLDRDIIDLSGTPGPNHDGGKIAFAPNGKLFAVVGDTNREERTQNFENSSAVSRSSMIIRVPPTGGKIASNPFATPGSKHVARDDIWAYGIRNSFGIAFDPLTGSLWDTENGPDRMDEINRVPAGFNSGWRHITGPKSRNGGTTGTLVSFGPRARYRDPLMSWDDPIAPTDLEFLSNSHLGSTYRNDLFLGDVNTGSLYHFDLSGDRQSLHLAGALADGVADNRTGGLLHESDSTLFGSGFGTTSDILTGPGGLYVLSLTNGTLYRISQNAVGASVPQMHAFAAVPEPSAVLAVFCLLIAGRRRA